MRKTGTIDWKWSFKQLLPFKYKTHYGENGKWYYTEWRMFLGRCFNVSSQEIPVVFTVENASATKVEANVNKLLSMGYSLDGATYLDDDKSTIRQKMKLRTE